MVRGIKDNCQFFISLLVIYYSFQELLFIYFNKYSLYQFQQFYEKAPYSFIKSVTYDTFLYFGKNFLLAYLTIAKVKLNFHNNQFIISIFINYLLLMVILPNFDAKQSLMNVGDNIKKLRKEKGLQQKQIAIELGIDQSNYNKIENGKREPSLDLLN